MKLRSFTTTGLLRATVLKFKSSETLLPEIFLLVAMILYKLKSWRNDMPEIFLLIAMILYLITDK